ncbi:amidohydrolase family protein [Paenibacillus sp. SC116]|uniref:amidohydrolase family protein n=1 Tax=Paenibacillus sp. SC116 TaxID=2968986 RepID=UPI00215AF060|nr:amidohydrolase family protein [Paenibacillus sp. SC116]MCR8846480.1 amidohydrolase family protein [Paenibacillus sp. SC116]
MNASTYWLTNVLLEVAFEKEQDVVVGTQTALHHIQVKEGVIADIIAVGQLPDDGIPHVDAKGLLMLPSFKEMHIHIDKTYYGGPWKAVRPATSIFDRLAEEQVILKQQLPTVKERAAKMLDLLLGHGATHIRTHVNVDPIVETKNMELTLQVLSDYAGKLTAESVAFPQHGLLKSSSVDRVKGAMRLGATHVGAVDPAVVDDNIEMSLATLMDIAVEFDAGIDLHLHERNQLGLYTMNKLADLTEEAGWQGRVTVSHAFGFAGPVTKAAEQLAERFAELGISISSTVPIGAVQMPIPMLREKGVLVELGNDSITDHWSPFGTGDMLEKANRMAELYGYADEYSLSRALTCITGGVTPLDNDGKQVWPVQGVLADAVFVKASCSAEAVARRSDRRAVMFMGQVVAGTL